MAQGCCAKAKAPRSQSILWQGIVLQNMAQATLSGALLRNGKALRAIVTSGTGVAMQSEAQA